MATNRVAGWVVRSASIVAAAANGYARVVPDSARVAITTVTGVVRWNVAHQPVRAAEEPMHDRRIQTETIALILHRLAAPSNGIGQGRRHPRHGAEDVAPVVQRLGEVDDSPAAGRDHFGGAQDEVVILRTVEAWFGIPRPR